MDKTMWFDILKNDKFYEDYGFINNADIANWFQTLEDTFDNMLKRVGLESGPESLGELEEILSGGYAPRANKRLSFNQRKIKELGFDIAHDILTEGIMAFVTEYSKTLEDDSEQSISSLLGSTAYKKTEEALYDAAESLLSGIFDACFEGVRTQQDRPPTDFNEEDTTTINIDPDEPLTSEFKELVKRITDTEITRTTPMIVERIKKDLSKIYMDDQRPIGSLVGEKLTEVVNKPEVQNMLEDFTGYVFQSFMIKFPLQQLRMSRDERVADQSEMPPDFKFEIEDKDEYDRKREEFEEEYKSYEQRTDKLDWFSILSKEAGVGLSSSASFSPAIHNLTYGKKPPCEKCTDKKTACGCDE